MTETPSSAPVPICKPSSRPRRSWLVCLWRRFMDAAFGLSLIAIAGYFSYNAFVENQRPRIIKDIWLEPTIIQPGRSFKVHIRVQINQICAGEVHWSLFRDADNFEVAKVVQPTLTPVKVGEQVITNERLVPPTVPPGEYYYKATVFDLCGPNRETFTAITKNVHFTVR